MQNIDPLYFITPIVVIVFSFGLVIYWHYRRGFSKWALVYSLAAYAGAIVLKYLIQIPTIGAVDSTFADNPAILGLYYGVQTAVFEVGGAFLVASIAVSRGHFKAKDAGGYGLGLAFWENGILIALPLLINYVAYYSILSTPNSTIAQALYSALSKSAPGLFYGTSGALPLIGYAILERVSSLLAHFAWGFLCVLAAVYRKKIYLAVAFPVGFLIDFLVPFSQRLGIGRFELLVFIVAAGGLIAALVMTQRVRKQLKAGLSGAAGSVGSSAPINQTEVQANLGSLSAINFKRSVNYGKVYLIIAIVMSLILVFTTSFLTTTPQTHRYIAGEGQALGISNPGALVIISVYPIISPLFAVIGSLGALMIFASDKAKGVYEYLIAYGVNTSSIFWSIILSAVGMATIVLAVSLPVVTGILIALNGSVPSEFIELVLIYTIPLAYAVTMFTAIIGMVWSSLTTRRAGVNSPVGLAPVFGIVPIVIVLLVSESIPPRYLTLLVGVVALALVLLVTVLISVSSKKMVKERFISNV
ncbi:MAG: YhfC family glutamic-type intramembrane protease [Nitrososphaerales archaeon]